MDKYQALFQVVMILFGCYQLVTCNVWSDENCSEYFIYPECYSQHNCIRISEFATNLSDYLQPCTHLILQPGNHTLNSPFFITNVENFSLSTYGNFSGTTIVCANQYMISFEHVSHVHIGGVTFIRCKIVVNSTKNYKLQDISFYGMHLTGTALFSVNSTSYLSKCSFAQFHGTQFNNVIIGGAIIISHSTFHMHDCVLEDNRAQRGGAIFIEQNSSLLLLICMMNRNHDHPSRSRYISTKGGAIFIHHSYHIAVIKSTFTNNTASQGGVLYIEGHSVPNTIVEVTLTNSTFAQNSGQYGGVIYARFQTLNVYNGYFTNNTARYYGGVCLFTCNFTQNYAGDGGGAIFAYSANTNIYSSNFIHNTASAFGGAVFALYANIFVYDSNFLDNAAIFAGGGALSLGCSVIELYNTNFSQNNAYIGRSLDFNEVAAKIIGGTFVENAAEYYGGALYANNANAQVDIDSSCISDRISQYEVAVDTIKISITESDMINNSAKFGGAIYLIKCNSMIKGSEQRRNLAQYGGAFYAIDSNTTVVQLLSMNNTAKVVGIIVLFDGTLNISESLLIDNKAFGVLSLTGCESTFRGNIHFTNNIGSLSILTSVVEFIGNITFSYNSPLPEHITPVSEGGAMTVLQSIVRFNGAITFHNNHAMDGGAILSGESSIFSDGHIKITNNSASSSGGGIYFYRSRVDVKGTCTIVENSSEERWRNKQH